MDRLEDRIIYVERAIKTLSNWKPVDHNSELNRIINIAEYREELEALNKAKLYLVDAN